MICYLCMKWYYTKNNAQQGPVTFAELQTLAAQGILDKQSTLVWQEGSPDWIPAHTVPNLFSTAITANPYAAPQTSWEAPALVHASSGPDIIPGSDPIEATACVSRAFALTSKHFGQIFLLGLVYVAITFALGVLLGLMDSALGLQTPFTPSEDSDLMWQLQMQNEGSIYNSIISNVVSSILGLGVLRFFLNIVDGKPTQISMLFTEWRKFFTYFIASLIYGLAVGVGLLLLIVPGIYIAIKYGYYQYAIVDRNMGILDSLNYSASITENSKMNLFVLGILGFLIIIAGIIALLVGLVFALPLVYMASAVAYRWMQRGREAVMAEHVQG